MTQDITLALETENATERTIEVVSLILKNGKGDKRKMTELILLIATVCACIVAIALAVLIVTWVIKCVLEWLDDIAYWWKEFKSRRK